MDDVPPAIARAIVLRHLPRASRAALDPEAAYGPLPAQLAADADTASPGLGASVAAWIRGHVGECAGLSRWIDETVRGDPAHACLAALDQAAAAHDDPVLREIADALLPLGDLEAVAPLAGRAASAAWAYLDRMTEAGATLHGLALASSGVLAADTAVDPPWPGLEAVEGIHRPEAATEAATTAWREAVDAAFAQLCGEARLLAIGLSAIAAGRPRRIWGPESLAQAAIGIGRSVTEPLTLAAARDGRRYGKERAQAEIEALQARLRGYESTQDVPEADSDPGVDPGAAIQGIVVCPPLAATGPGKSRDVARGYEHAIGTALALVPTPDLACVRAELAAEFPYALPAIDSALGAFAGRTHVHAAPLLVAGPPGAGKSRFVRRLGETLGVGVYRVDGSNDGGASFGGTERRWFSSEPCRPFMAIARHRHANPIVLVDEVDKAASRSDYGRLWDSMLQVLDPENATRFPDPCLQAELDISRVTVVCTANDASRLPGPLLDRLRVVRFPEPRPEHLDALLPGVLAAIAVEDGLDPGFLPPLDGIERAALAARWRGGSVRRLRRAVEAVLRVRQRTLAGRPQ